MNDVRAAMIDAVLLYGIESGTHDKYPDAMVDAILRALAENGYVVTDKQKLDRPEDLAMNERLRAFIKLRLDTRRLSRRMTDGN